MLKKIEEMVIFRHITTPLSTASLTVPTTGMNGVSGSSNGGNSNGGSSNGTNSDTRHVVIADPLYKDDNEYRKSG